MNKGSKKNTHPKISFILCCYNVANYIPDMMNSLLNQTYKNKSGQEISVANSKDIEIIFIEDCSTDKGKTLNVCKKYASKFENIKVYKQRKNGGLSAGRNIGIKKANGKYISFPDPDDLMAEGIINEYMKAVYESNYDIICSGVIERHYDSNNKLVLEKKIELSNKKLTTKKQIAKQSIQLEKNVCFGYAWNKLYKLSIIKNNKLQFIKGLQFIEDILFNIEFCKNSKTMRIINAPSIIYNRRLKSSNSITSHYEKDYFELHYLRIETLYNYWKQSGVLDKKAKEILSNLYLRYSLSAIWRNKDKKSKMNYAKQRLWIKNYYELELTKELLPFAKSESVKNNISNWLFKKKQVDLLLAEASIIKFITNNMNKTLIKFRQKR